MYILSINAGSSSVKYSLIDIIEEKVILRGIVENIGSDASVLKQTNNRQQIVVKEQYTNHEQSIQKIISMLTHAEYGAVSNLESVFAVGHRIAHGGEKLFKPTVIDESVLEQIRENIPLAPLHMPHMVGGIEAFIKLMPGKPMVAVFDTAFHQTMPQKAYLYAIPYDYYLKYGIRRYGFHGTSHKYVSIQAAKLFGKPYESMKMITCHLGNGSSISAIRNGKCVDTSMGFTPLSGVPMGTRCGDIDPAIIGFIMKKEGKTYQEVESVLNNESGFLGISGVTNDCRELEILRQDGNKRASTALELFCYNVKKYIGSYAAVMNSLDCIIFTGGIGENSAYIRECICSELDIIGVRIDDLANSSLNTTDASIISSDDSKTAVCIIKTNEELMIGYETYDAIQALN